MGSRKWGTQERGKVKEILGEKSWDGSSTGINQPSRLASEDRALPLKKGVFSGNKQLNLHF